VRAQSITSVEAFLDTAKVIDLDFITVEAWIPDTLRSFQSLTRSGMTITF
jgi:hypothetical protein